MKITIKDVHRQIGEPATPTHRYDKSMKKIYDVETHRHVLKAQADFASLGLGFRGRKIWVPKESKGRLHGNLRSPA
jgi:hypothetical protein